MRRSWPPVICSLTSSLTASVGREPGEVERLLGRDAVATDRNDVGQAHRVVAGIVEPGTIGFGEVLDNSERRRVRRHVRERQRSEVLLEVTQECVADSLAEHHAPRHRPSG